MACPMGCLLKCQTLICVECGGVWWSQSVAPWHVLGKGKPAVQYVCICQAQAHQKYHCEFIHLLRVLMQCIGPLRGHSCVM